MAIAFTVLGEAQPKGSTKTLPSGRVLGALRRGQTFTIRSVRDLLSAVITTSDNPALKSWQSRVAFAATTALRGVQLELAGGVHVTADFYLPRPKALAKSYQGPHLKKPDLDKLQRAVLDALTGVLYADDNQVAKLDGEKKYASLGDEPRCEITVRSLAAHAPRKD